MPRLKQTYQCYNCGEVFRDNYQLNRHINRKKPCTGYETSLSKKLKKKKPQELTEADLKKYLKEIKEANELNAPLTRKQLATLKYVINSGIDTLKYGLDPSVVAELAVNQDLFNLVVDAKQMNSLPPIEDIEVLTAEYYKVLMKNDPSRDEAEAFTEAQELAQQTINEQLAAYRKNLYATQNPLVAEQAAYKQFYSPQKSDASNYKQKSDNLFKFWTFRISVFLSSFLATLTGGVVYITAKPFQLLESLFIGMGGVQSVWLPNFVTGAWNWLVSSLGTVMSTLAQSLNSPWVFGGTYVMVFVICFVVFMIFFRLVFASNVAVGPLGARIEL